MANDGSRRSRSAEIRTKAPAAAVGNTAAAPAGAAADRPRALRHLLPAILIVAAALAAYAPALRAGFVWDDNTFLAENPLIRAPDGLYRLWITATTPDYYPLAFSLLWYEWRLWGTNAAGYHLVNILLHAAAAVLLWRVLRRLKIPGAWLAGLLFAVHPAAVESVAWIEEHKSTLPIVFCLASLLAWLAAEDRVRSAECGVQSAEHTEARSPARRPFRSVFCILRSAFCARCYLLSLALFLLALLAKTSVVFLPAVLLLCAWWRKGRIEKRDWLRVLPFAALALAMGLVTVWFQYHNAAKYEIVRADSLAARAACAGWAAWFYLYKDLVPLNLCFVYPRWTMSASLLAFVPDLLLVALLLLFARFRRTWGRPSLFALGYFLAALLPVLGFLNIYFMRYSLVADHWQYPALIGVIALAAGLLGRLMERPAEQARRSAGRGGRRPAAIALAAALFLACGILTFRQTLIYHDDETLWRDTETKNPKAWLAHLRLGGILLEKAVAAGAESAPRDFQQAEREMDQAVALQPDRAGAYVARGQLYAATGRYGDALRDLDKAVALQPTSLAYVIRGDIRSAAGHYADAIADYTLVISQFPDDAQARLGRARAWYALKDYTRALSDMRAIERLGGRLNPELLRALEQAAGAGGEVRNKNDER